MWVVRELLRLLGRILVGLSIAIVLAGVRALLSGGDVFWTFRVTAMLLGGIYLLLGAAGSGSAASHRVNWMPITPGRGNIIARFRIRTRPNDPTLTPRAVFIAAGAALLVFGAVA